MVTVGFLVSRIGGVVGFTIQGHSDLGERGSDILCAAVSSAAFLTVNTVTDVLRVTPMALRVEEGDMYFRIEQKDEPLCRDILDGLKLHLGSLEEQYPENLRVSYVEV